MRHAIDALLIIEGLNGKKLSNISEHNFYQTGTRVFLHPSYAEQITKDAEDYLNTAEEMSHHYNSRDVRLYQ